MNFRDANGDPALFKRQPGRKVGSMVKAGDYDLIARTQFAPDRAADRERERSHICAEDHLCRIAGKKVRHGLAGAGKDGLGTLAGGKGAVHVGIAAAQIIADGVNDTLRNLRATWSIEKNSRMAIDGLRKRRKLGADPGYIEGAGALVRMGIGEIFGNG